VRSTQGIDDKNPFDFEYVKARIEHGLREFEGRFAVVPLPNISHVFYGRDIGYTVERIDLEAIGFPNDRGRQILPNPSTFRRLDPRNGRSSCDPFRGKHAEHSPDRKIEIRIRERLIVEREVPPLLVVGPKAAAGHRRGEQRAVLLRLVAHARIRWP
jgi:hypothetical protein